MDAYRGQGRMEDAAKLEKLTQKSEKTLSSFYSHQIYSESQSLDKLEDVSVTPKKQVNFVGGFEPSKY